MITTKLIGGPADGQVAHGVDTNVEVWRVAVRTGNPDIDDIAQYRRHEVRGGSGWGSTYVYAHESLSPADVTERLNEHL